MKGHIVRGLAFTTALVALTACASTRFTETWRNPNIAPEHFRKVVAMAVVGPATLRRVAEDEIVRTLPAGEAIPSYQVLSDAEIRDPAQALAHLRGAGFDGAITMRVLSDQDKVRYVPGTTFPDFPTFLGYAWPPVYDPGYYVTDREVQVETNVYALPSQQLIWSGVSRTQNPANFGAMAREVAKGVRGRLESQGILQACGDCGAGNS